MTSSSFFAPTERALEFGTLYGEVLARWGELFASASALVEANVRLVQLTLDSSKEWEEWLQQTARAPWNWLNPENLRRFMPQPPASND